MSNPTVTNVDGTNSGPNTTTAPSPYLNQGGPNQFGVNATSLNAFYGATPIAQRSSSAQTTLSLSVGVSSSSWGWNTSDQAIAVGAQLAEICATLKLLGLWKGS